MMAINFVGTGILSIHAFNVFLPLRRLLIVKMNLQLSCCAEFDHLRVYEVFGFAVYESDVGI